MNKETLLQMLERRSKHTVPVVVDGETYYVRRLSVADLNMIDEATTKDEQGQSDVDEKLNRIVAASLSDDKGQRLFQDQDWQLAKGLDKPLYEALVKASWNLISPFADEDELVKNSKSEQT